MAHFGTTFIWTFSVLFVRTSAYRFYQDQIPNADLVPHPCKPNYLWRGVGHMNPLGGGDRNMFGKDFQETHTWTEKLCRKDSDGDGKTNGEELGDPDCKWKPGTFPLKEDGITHPGICEPWGDAKCKESNKMVTCDTGELQCDAIHSSDVKNFTLRIPKTKVPAQVTTYMCMTFDIPAEVEGIVHVIASKPYIDNADVMHHLIAGTCDDTGPGIPEPQPCYMALSACNGGLVGWTVGLPGECFHENAGMMIGVQGRRRIGLQFHWTNPKLRKDYNDSSGITLFYTRNLRKYNLGIITTGERKLYIPPGKSLVPFKSTCKKECTEKGIHGRIFLTRGLNHMHYLGYQQSIVMYRGGKKVRDLTNDAQYSYDSPKSYIYEKPVEMIPGDELVTTCSFRSTSRARTTLYGEGTFEEMCFGFLWYYPAENMTRSNCVTYGEINVCDIKNGVINGCNTMIFRNHNHPETKKIFKMVLDSCSPYGGCRVECPAVVTEVRKDPCLQGDLEPYHLEIFARSKYVEPVKFAAALTSCDPDPNIQPPLPPSGGSNRRCFSFLTVAILIVVSTCLL